MFTSVLQVRTAFCTKGAIWRFGHKMQFTREERKVIAAAVANNPELAATHDHFLRRFEEQNGPGIGSDTAAIMLYEVGHWMVR